MNCSICNRPTTVETSVGYDDFIVCNDCHDKLGDYTLENFPSVMNFIFKCGKIRRELNAKKVPNEQRDYRVLYEFEGCYEVQVRASSKEEAIQKGRDMFYYDEIDISESAAHAVTEEEYQKMGSWN